MPKTIPYADRFPDEALVQYLLRLITTIIATHGGDAKEIRIPHQDLIENADGCGFVKSWDAPTRTLILRHAAEHTEAFFKVGDKPLGAPAQPKQPVPINRSASAILEERAPAIGEQVDLSRASRVVHSLLKDDVVEELDTHQRMRTEDKLRQFFTEK